ncbi:MAG: SDR family oxidoreductase [bacterium]|nr:SDR family oxidoreductase [bacterium]
MSNWALIIGGSSGIGLASAKKLAQEGFGIIIIHRDRRSVLETVEKEFEEIKGAAKGFLALNYDATNHDKIDESLEQIKTTVGENGIKMVVHAVSRGNLKPFIGENSTLNETDITLTINAMGSNLLTWVQKLKKLNLIVWGSRVIALTSEGNNKYWSGYGAVAMAKAALETMMKYLAVELAPEGITLNTIQAGVTDTPSLQLIPGYEQLINGAKERNPHHRTTTPEDVANVVYLLSRDEAQWVSGSLIHVDGGENFM